MRTVLKNATVFDERFCPQEHDLLLEDGRIAAVGARGAFTAADAEQVDLSGLTVIPGMIDIHIHGYGGADTGDADPASIETMSARLAQHGVTAFCPTSMTLPADRLEAIFRCVAQSAGHTSGARPVGINMEGPYISPGKVGGQNPAFVRKPDAAEFMRLQEACGGMIRLVDIAPEEDTDGAFIRTVSASGTVVSVAHTGADYDAACVAFAAGCRHVTHLYNAMSGLNHRNPGVVGAVFDKAQEYGLHAELICDGKHIHPAALRIAFAQLGRDRSVIISDALSAAGTSDGRMVSGGLPVVVRDGVAYLDSGVIAGSTTDLEHELQNVLHFGVPMEQALRSVTVNPARAIGMDGEIGRICAGYRADLTVMDDAWNVVLTYVGGKCVFRRA